MGKVYFVSGIDTDAGKTYATGWMARKWMDDGLKVATLKFIQTGCEGFSEDIEMHRHMMGGSIPEDESLITAPVIFKYPASAQLAARLENKEIPLGKIDESIDVLQRRYDIVLVEGAGGLMVPLTDTFLSIDYVKSRNLPLILVTNGILGSINHTILSLEAIKSREIPLYALVYNCHFDNDPIISEDTQGFLHRYLSRNFPQSQWIEIPSLGHIQ